MRTPAIPKLPRPPDITRAQCAGARRIDSIHYLSDYLWKLNQALSQFFPFIFSDMKYGFLHFLDGDMTFDGITIDDVEYTTGFDEVYDMEFPDPWGIRKYGTDGDDCTGAWVDYADYPTLETFSVDQPLWSCGYSGPLGYYVAQGRKLYAYFDTSAAIAGGTSLKITFNCSSVSNTGGSSLILYVYTYDWGTAVSASNETDWTGGDKVAELEIDSVGDKEIVLDTDIINIGGETRFKFSLKDIEDDTYIDGVQGFAWSAKKLRWAS